MNVMKLSLGYEVIDFVDKGSISDMSVVTGYPFWVDGNAPIGSIFNTETERFTTKSPFPSWILDEGGEWIPPTLMPKQDKFYYSWDEATTSWVQGDAVIGDGKEPVDKDGNPWVYE